MPEARAPDETGPPGRPRPILSHTDPLLRRVATPVTPAELRGAGMRALIADMFATVRANALLGMAAPQIGVSRRLFVVDFAEGGTRHGPLVVANPKLLKAEGRMGGEEGSPCRPGATWTVERAARLRCRGLDRAGAPFTLKAEGTLAACVQHEIDHLDGILCFDRAAAPDTGVGAGGDRS